MSLRLRSRIDHRERRDQFGSGVFDLKGCPSGAFRAYAWSYERDDGKRRFFTRLTNAFSKNYLNHCAAVALYVMHYNFCRAHEALRVTPAMQLGVTDHVWTIDGPLFCFRGAEFFALVESLHGDYAALACRKRFGELT